MIYANASRVQKKECSLRIRTPMPEALPALTEGMLTDLDDGIACSSKEREHCGR